MLRVEDARNAGKLIDDFVDEFMRDAAEVSHSTGITLTDPFFVLINVK